MPKFSTTLTKFSNKWWGEGVQHPPYGSPLDQHVHKVFFYCRWYQKDDNADPPVYVLQRISTRLPDFISSDNDAKMKAKEMWWVDSDKMQDILATTAEKCLGPEKARNYVVSGKTGIFFYYT